MTATVLVRLLRFALLFAALLSPLTASAHEVRPAYLEIREDAAHNIDALWKQPAAGRMSLPLAPKLSAGWLRADTARQTVTDSFVIQQWHLDAPAEPLHGQQLTIEGLDRSITDVLVRITFANGETVSRVLKPDNAGMEVLQPGRSTLPAAEYFQLGVTHIWQGVDHLLYVFGLLLLVRGARPLVRTITAFTLAHSLTLAAAALKLVEVRPAVVELVIALSIVYVAVELLHLRQGRPGLASRAPWVVAFSFGLLHGFGFAGALADVGLPPDAIPAALLLFNVGIEAGQLAFVFAALGAIAGLRRIVPWIEQTVARLAPWVIGSLASFWCVERAVHIF
ncbi:HupE/UreJ family protein [Aromatoleum toluclasticum]|uniref:HupE/UreJ family protein n=1 Tax=Aromatoleum toluclasticum TaxID=92003 RepID=UPI001D17E578|nr:HupE/UreJ family protein [Aromatoleum toluclasticum]MCC4116866.1 HupE/UreJ family protein [Aromatoleum toluclasticum]